MAKTKIKDLSLTGGAFSKSKGNKVRAPFAPPKRAAKATSNIAADIKGGATKKPEMLPEILPGTRP